MPDTNWERVRAIFGDALQRPFDERTRYLDEMCGDDTDLLNEVSSLLFSFQSADSFMEMPAVTQVADIIEAGKGGLAEGTRFGHYEIVRQIGVGGMGAVYLAKDGKLDREVALKILDENLGLRDSHPNRFTQEAKAASALNHPNILVIHEIGESDGAHYIVSEYIKGKTLRDIFRDGSLKLSDSLNISIQIANALCAAHEARIIHRDVKPENIMIRPDGIAKILDFGLAKLVERKENSIFTLRKTRENQTAKGIILGTVNYMSPEQAKGERVDERSDIFSFGALIYEMLTGRTPFAGDTNSETFANIINAEPRDLAPHAANIPDKLARLVLKMLRKDKKERYQTMKEVLADLKSIAEDPALGDDLERAYPLGAGKTEALQRTTGGGHTRTGAILESLSLAIKQHRSLTAATAVGLLAGTIVLIFYFYGAGNAAVAGQRSIAVLPLKAINSANRDEIYEMGIADSLIYKLGSMKGIIVRPLSATREYSDISQDPIAAGKEQQVDYVLASNYEIADGKIRVTSQLFDVATGKIDETVKSEKDAADDFTSQDLIAGEISNKLAALLGASATGKQAKGGTDNEEAYRLYIQGTVLADKRNDVRKAIEYFEQAVQLDPTFALAYAELANAHIFAFNGNGRSATEGYIKAKAAIEKALAIAPDLAEAHSYLGVIKTNYEWDFAGAELEQKRAIELDPNSSDAHGAYARLLVILGRFDESIAEMKTAIELEPASAGNHHSFGWILFQSHRYDEAIAEEKRALEMDPTIMMSYNVLANSWGMKGDDDRSFEAFVQFQILSGAEPDEINSLKTTYARSGWRGISERRLEDEKQDEKKGNPNYANLAGISIELGQNEQALAYLEKAVDQNRFTLITLKVNPRYDPLRSDPRFDDLVRRVGLN